MAGNNIRRNLKAYVKYNKFTRLIVPGSLVIREHAPKDGGIWEEVPIKKCCSNSGANCSSLPWINDLVPDYYGLISETLDDNCNAYFYGVDGPNQVFMKFNARGDLVWKRIYNIYINDNIQYIDGAVVSVSPDGFPYFAHTYGIFKVDPTNGDIIWQKHFGQLIPMYMSGVVLDNSGNFFLTSNDSNSGYYIGKFDASTGNVINQISFRACPSTVATAYIAYNSDIDSSGNIYIPTAFRESAYGWRGSVFKFDNDLNFVSANEPDPAVYTLDTDIIGFGVDSENCSYANAYGTLLYKLNADGSLAWAYTMNTAAGQVNIYIEQFALNKQTGDVFWIFSNNQSYWDPAGTNSDCIAIIKFDKDGNYLWATEISAPPGGYVYLDWFEMNNSTSGSNYTIQISCYSSAVVSGAVGYIKMSAIDQTIGTFGSYTFRDVTSLFTPIQEIITSIPTPYSISATTAFSESNVQPLVTFIEVSDIVTATKTPLT